MKEKTILGGSVIAAFAASLCCIAPLLFILIGVGSLGVGAIFETVRPYMMAATVLLLSLAYYRIYFRSEPVCAPGEACAVKSGRSRARLGLWLATIAVVLFAMMPYAAAPIAAHFASKTNDVLVVKGDTDCCLLNKNSEPAHLDTSREVNLSDNLAQARFTVTGMTCESCEIMIKLALEKAPGVKRAKVSYNQGNAVIDYDPKQISKEKLRDVINGTGYKVKE